MHLGRCLGLGPKGPCGAKLRNQIKPGWEMDRKAARAEKGQRAGPHAKCSVLLSAFAKRTFPQTPGKVSLFSQ